MSKILVVDDEPAIRGVLKRFLEKKGYEVAVAEDGVQAQRILEGQSVDLAFVDFLMPRMDGVELIKWIRLKYPKTQLVAITGFDRRVAPRGPEADSLAVVRKPFTLEEIEAVIERFERGERLTGGSE